MAMEQSDAERKASARRAVRVHATTSDGRRRCLLTFDSAVENFEGLRTRLASELSLKEDFICTYSTSPKFLLSPTRNPYQQQELSSDLELSCAVLTATETEDGALFIRTHLQWSGSFSRLTLCRGLHRRTSFQADWDLLDETKDVIRLWRQLPSLTDVPFAHILHEEQHRRHGQLARRLHGLQNMLPLQDFEWVHFLDPRRRLVREADLRLRVYHSGVHPALRPIVWRHLLYVFPPMLTGDERHEFLSFQRDEYRRLRSSWQNLDTYSPERSLLLTCIRNDVARTDRTLPFFAGEDNPHLDALFNVLVTFALNCPETSYLQGLNDIAGILLMVYDGMEADTYIVFYSFMRMAHSLFTPDGLALKFAHLKALLHRYDTDFFDYLAGCNSHELLFTYRWLLLEMKREFPVADAMRVMEVMWSTLSPPAEYTACLQRIRSSLQPVGAPLQGDEEQVNQTDGDRQQSGFELASIGNGSVCDLVDDTWAVIDYTSPGILEHSAVTVSSPVNVDLVQLGQRALIKSISSESASSTASISRNQRPNNLLSDEEAAFPVDAQSHSGSVFPNDPSPAGEQGSSVGVLAAPSNTLLSNSWEDISKPPCGETEAENADRVGKAFDRSFDQVSNSSVKPQARAQVAEDSPAMHSLKLTNESLSNSLQGFALSQTPPVADAALDAALLGDSILAEEARGDECSDDAIQATYGSLFVLFVSLAIILRHRDQIMQHHLEEEEIAIYFDKQKCHHNLSRVLEKARSLMDAFVSSEL